MSARPVGFAASVSNVIAASAMMSGVRDLAASDSPSRLITAEVAMVVWGHRQFARTPRSASSAANPRVSNVIPYFDIM